ncbi:MAG: SDR family oxidoreductase [Nitrospinae bacterium]|nr:SDR family oxidoreductase [Nitrospinota bacterium]
MTTPSNIKTVLITGASSGIGLGVAQAYLDLGANVVLNARNEAKLTEVAKNLGRSDQIAVVPGDIGLKETGQRMVDAAVERFGRVDVLLNNAGHFFSKPFTEYTEEDLDGFLSAHLKGTYLTSQAAARQMRTQGGGAIINITTVLASRGVTAIPASALVAAKGAMNAITTSLAIELAPDNIRVNAVALGIIKTPIHGMTDEQFEELNAMQPLGRVGEIKDAVDAVLYLADANFVTGVVLPVDGGVAAGGE